MFTKKRIIQFLALVVIFLAAIIWIYSQLSTSFEEYVEERNFNEIELFAQTNPEDGASDEELGTWLDSVSEMIPGARSAYLKYDFDTFNFVASLGSQPLLDLFNANASTPAFIEATDSCYYLVPMRMNTTYQVDYSLDPDDTVSTAENSILYFIPIVDETGYQASGAIMIAVPEIAATGFESLLRTLLVMLSAAFIIVSFIIMFTRDPMTGFLVLALFVIVALFVAFPLFEAVRLSFLVNGHLSFDTWKACLSPTYLQALWGSLKLGILTATSSTLVGFLFAFLIERTSFKQKKLMTTLATMPMISPPFSLSLSIILLFGNNGLITKQLLHLNTSIYGLGGLVIVETIGMFPIAFMTISRCLEYFQPGFWYSPIPLLILQTLSFFQGTTGFFRLRHT